MKTFKDILSEDVYLVKMSNKDGKTMVRQYRGKSEMDVSSKAKVDAKIRGFSVDSVRLMSKEKEEVDEAFVASADYKLSPSGRKVHKMKKVNDEPEDDEDEKKDVKEELNKSDVPAYLRKKTGDKLTTQDLEKERTKNRSHPDTIKKINGVEEGAVPAHMQGKQKPYVSSDGKGNYEVLGNKGQTKATFSRKEHGTEAQKKAQAHLRSKYDEYMKEEVEQLDETETTREFHLRQAAHHEKQGNAERAKYHRDQANDWRVKAAHDDSKRAQRELEHKYRRESIEEAVDKQEQRFLQLARLGLVDKSDVSKLRIALDQLKADKPLTVPQRTMLLGVMSDLISLVTGDDTIFNRVKMDVQKESTDVEIVEEESIVLEGENKQMKGKDPCWKGYQMVGMKDKNGKKVPNCVPTEEKEVEEGYVSDAQRKAVWAARNDAKEKKEETEPPFDKPYTKTKGTTTDKSGAKHSPMSAARHLARLALQKQQQKKKLKEECDDCYEEIIEDFEVGGEQYLDEGIDELFEEIEYQGRKVTLNKPFAGDGKKKRYVYVKNEKGNVVKVGFGDPNMEIRRDDPERRSNFRARHNCDTPGPKWKARYWSCKYWSTTPVSKM